MNLQVDPKPYTLLEPPIDPFKGTLNLELWNPKTSQGKPTCPSGPDRDPKTQGEPGGTRRQSPEGFRVQGLGFRVQGSWFRV